MRTGRRYALTVVLVRRCRRSERVPDVAELGADLAAQKDQGDDGDDGDKGKNECVFGQSLAVVCARVASHPRKQSLNERHPVHLLSMRLREVCYRSLITVLDRCP